MKMFLSSLLAVLVLGAPASAQIKQWIDARGILHFANIAPAPIERLDYRQATAAIMSVMREMGLPPIDPVLLVYDGREFEQALVKELSVQPEVAAQFASFATAVASGKQILINESRLARKGRSEQIRLLAHELTHAVQYALADPRGLAAADTWLVEGFAEWLSHEVLRRLGAWTYAQDKSIWRARHNQQSPALTEMRSLSEWLAHSNSLGVDATYGRAHLATEFLIERSGVAAVLHYFDLFNRLTDHHANFLAAFGLPHSNFEIELALHLRN